MDFTEDMVYNALGLEKEESEDMEETKTSDEDFEKEDTEKETKETEDAEKVKDTSFSGEDEQKKDSLTEDERADNAARRRRKEEEERTKHAVEAAVNAERERASAELKDFFEKAKLKNTMTGEDIKSLDEFHEWKKSYDRKVTEREIEEGNITPETLDRYIAENPDVKAAREIIEKENERRRIEEEKAAEEKIQKEIEEIHKLDASINSVSDLLLMEGADTFRDYVKKGNSFIDAFYLTRRESLINKKAEEATKQRMANIAGKSHLKATGSARGAGAPSVPREDMEMFRVFNPGASEADINAYYKKNRKEE